MRKLTLFTVTILLALTTFSPLAYAALAPRQAVFTPPVTWRADGSGQYEFNGAVSLDKAGIAKDGSVNSTQGGTCELKAAYTTEGKILTIAANWTFTGKVTMEVSATGDAKDYTPITNGVPLTSDKFTAGSSLKWRATLDPQSALAEVRIACTDASGAAGTFGNPDISGFAARKKITIKGSTDTALYNFQVQIKAGESQKAAGCDVYLESPSKADLADIRFTQADGVTSLPYFRESITGAKPNRVAAFWVKIPEIPKGGLPIYVYYSCAGASDLSNGEQVFDFFDDFNLAALDGAKWKVALEGKTSQAYVSGSMLNIDAARATTANYNFNNGIIEYRAKVSGNGSIVGIIASGQTADDDLTACASIIAASANSIEYGGKVKADDPKQIALDTYYDFKIISNNGDITFQRYADGWGAAPQAQAQYSPGSSQAASTIGLSAGMAGSGLACDYIRTRQYTAVPPQVDLDKTALAKEEVTNLPQFNNLTLAPDGSIILAQNATSGDYMSQLIKASFQARILTASWIANDSSPSLRGAEGGEAIYISTKEPAVFTTGWQNGIAKYVSKKEFAKGDQLRYKAVIARSRATNQSPSLKKFTLAFQPGTIKIVTPSGGESVMPGSVYNVLWETTGYDPAYNMDISYSNDGGAAFQPIASAVANTGSYLWMAPPDESAKCEIMVTDSADKTIYAVSDNYFSVTSSANAGTLADQQAQADAVSAAKTAAEALPVIASSEATKQSKTAASTKGGLKLYDLLIKSGSAPVAGRKGLKTSAGVFQDGDIVTIKPAGFVWGAAERANFTIVQAYLTDAEVTELTSPQEVTKGKDKAGRPVKEMVKVRKHRIDLTKPGAIGKNIAGGTQLITGQAMVDKSSE